MTQIKNSPFTLKLLMKDKVRKLDVAFDPVHQKIADGLIEEVISLENEIQAQRQV